MLAASIWISTRELAGFCSSSSTVPLKFSNRPRTFEIIIWRTENWTCEWGWSICQDMVSFSCSCAAYCVRLSAHSIPLGREQQREQEREQIGAIFVRAVLLDTKR